MLCLLLDYYYDVYYYIFPFLGDFADNYDTYNDGDYDYKCTDVSLLWLDFFLLAFTELAVVILVVELLTWL